MTGVLDRALDASLLGYTRLGYLARKRAWSPVVSDLRGKTILITGSSRGIGKAAAMDLSTLGAHIILVGRDATRTEIARAEVEGAGGSAEARIADLSLVSEVRRLANEVRADHELMYALVNNVGVIFGERTTTSEGIESTLATNLLGQFVLTETLKDAISDRIVTVTSGGMYTQRIAVDDLAFEEGDYRPSVAYARTKRGQVILCEMWADQLDSKGVAVHCVHPGWVDTPGVRSSLPRFRKVLGPLLRDATQGADTIVWLVASEEAGRSTGRLWHDRTPRPTHRLPSTKESPEDRRRLWSALEDLAGSIPRQ